MTRPILAQINLAALRANLGIAAQRAAGAQVLAVVKANAWARAFARVARVDRGGWSRAA